MGSNAKAGRAHTGAGSRKMHRVWWRLFSRKMKTEEEGERRVGFLHRRWGTVKATCKSICFRMSLLLLQSQQGSAILKNKVLVNTTTPMHLHIAMPALSTTELSTCGSNLMAHNVENIYCLALYWKKFVGPWTRRRRYLVAEIPNLSFLCGCWHEQWVADSGL